MPVHSKKHNQNAGSNQFNPTLSATPTPTPTSKTPTWTWTWSSTKTPTKTVTPTPTPTFKAPTWTWTPTPTKAATKTWTATPTPTPTKTATPSPIPEVKYCLHFKNGWEMLKMQNKGPATIFTKKAINNAKRNLELKYHPDKCKQNGESEDLCVKIFQSLGPHLDVLDQFKEYFSSERDTILLSDLTSWKSSAPYKVKSFVLTLGDKIDLGNDC